MFRHSACDRTRLALPAAVLILILSAAPTAAQAPARSAPPPEIRGVVKSIDAKARTITATTSDGRSAPTEKTYKLADDAEIAFGNGIQPRGLYTAGKLEDIAAGSTVALTPAEGSDDTVTSVAANGPLLRGRLKKVDAAKKTITAQLFTNFGRDAAPEEKTFNVAPDAEIGVDDGRGRRFSVHEAKLGDLLEGSMLSLALSADGKTALSVIAEGPQINGIVLDNEAARHQLKLRVGPTARGEAPGERTIDVADDAVVVLDDGRGRRLSLTAGKLADVPAGSQVVVRLSVDQKQAEYVAASGPQTGGVLKEVDAEKRTIKVATFVARAQAPEEKTLAVAADARIIVDGHAARLADVTPVVDGSFVSLRLSLDQKTVQSLTVNQGR